VTYFQDLSIYEYSGVDNRVELPVLNVGWLGREFPIETGETSRVFQERLFRFCQDENIVIIARGIHVCEFCNLPMGEWLKRDRKFGENTHWMSVGTGEIRVMGQLVIYASPALIHHYVVEHQYRPPQEFIDAVLSGPGPGDDEYRELLAHYQVRPPAPRPADG